MVGLWNIPTTRTTIFCPKPIRGLVILIRIMTPGTGRIPYYTYDNVGNIMQINNDYYSYDGLNRLKWAGDQPTRKTGNGTQPLLDSNFGYSLMKIHPGLFRAQ